MSKAHPAPVAHPLAALVDELGALEAELAPVAGKLKRLESLRKLLRDAHADAPATETYRIEGARYSAIVGARGNQSIVDKAALYKVAGAKLFQQLAAVSLAAVEKHFPPSVVGAVVRLEQTGPRSLAVMTTPLVVLPHGKTNKRA